MTNDGINLFPTQDELVIFSELCHPYSFVINQQFGEEPSIELEVSASDFTRMFRGIFPSDERVDLKEFYFNAESTSLEVVKKSKEEFSSLNPPVPLMVLPSEYDLEGMTKEQLIQIRDKINKMIEASDFDTFVGD